MYYIDDYRKRAIDKVIPYLLEFPQIVKILECNADRYQAIEDLLWKVAENFKVIDSRGVFLKAHANNEVSEIIYTDKAKDAFTYGTDMPLYQAYGTGHYYSQASYISGTRKSISEEKLIRAVQAKIIQNNTNGTVEDIIEALKLLYNAEHVRVYESNPMNLSLMLIGSNLEISSSGNYENIKQFLPACVSFNNIFVDTSMFDLFMYDENSSYGDSRYPVRVDETVDKYFYISFSVTLDSEFKEYVVLDNDGFKENNFVCITGAFTKVTNNGTLLSSYENVYDEAFRIKTTLKDGLYYMAVEYNGVTYDTEYQVNEGDRYTTIIYNTGSELKVWFSNKVPLKGNFLSDTSYIENVISELTPDIIVENYTNFYAPVYLNCFNNNTGTTDFGDFTYYAVVMGEHDGSKIDANRYYVSCYGEKQLLFNCIKNEHHLSITTNNPLISNIMTKQSYYNYKQSHSAGKYLYLDGKSGIDYEIGEAHSKCEIQSFDISFDICMPVDIKKGSIISNFVNNAEDNSSICIENNGSISVNLTSIIEPESGDEDVEPEGQVNYVTVSTGEGIVKKDEYTKLRIEYKNKIIHVYKNNNLIYTSHVMGIISGMSPVLKIGYDNDLSSFYKGFIKNVNISITGEDEESVHNVFLSLPYKNKLQEENNIIKYVNYGARFITVPQLINDTTNLDLYGNELLSKRVYKE